MRFFVEFRERKVIYFQSECCKTQNFSFSASGKKFVQKRIHEISGSLPIDIHCQLCKVYGPQCMDVRSMQKWVSQFMYGCTDIHDKQRSGWPLVLAKTIAKVEQEMLEDRHVTVQELCERIPEVRV